MTDLKAKYIFKNSIPYIYLCVFVCVRAYVCNKNRTDSENEQLKCLESRRSFVMNKIWKDLDYSQEV